MRSLLVQVILRYFRSRGPLIIERFLATILLITAVMLVIIPKNLLAM